MACISCCTKTDAEGIVVVDRREKEDEGPGTPAPTAPEEDEDGNKSSFITPQRVFECLIEVKKQRLGIDINYHDGQTILVTKVGPGPILNHNRAKTDKLIMIGDRFVQVNEAVHDVKAMLASVSAEPWMRATVRRAYERTIQLIRVEDDHEDLGIRAEPFDEMCLVLTEEPPKKSILGDKNSEEPEFQLRLGDYITKVNDIEGQPEAMLKELGEGEEWIVTWRRIERKTDKP